MTDMITKGTGDSRYLKSVSDFLTRYPTYEDAVEALIAGTLPVDFNGLNAEGIAQQGTPLNKANLLSDATAALFGLTSSATVNDAFIELNKRSKIAYGSYVGTGVYGESNPNSLTFTFEPLLVMLSYSGRPQSFFGDNGLDGSTYNYGMLPAYRLTTSYAGGSGYNGMGFGETFSSGTYSLFAKISAGRRTISWYGTHSAGRQRNANNATYHYLAIGL